MFYIDQDTGEKKSLTSDEAELFNDLIGSIADGEVEDVENIIEDDPILAIAFDEDGLTALHFASTEPNLAGLAIVNILMNYGANPYAENNGHLTPIDDINDMTDKTLKAQFCEAMGIDTNTAAIIDGIINKRVHKIATERVEARWAAKKSAEGSPEKTDTERSSDELEEYFSRADVKKSMETSKAIIDGIKNLDVRMQTESTTSEKATQAIESMYSKSAKSEQLEFSVDQGISEMVSAVFGSKKSDISIDTKESVLASLCDWLGVDLSQLAYLASITIGSNILPFYHGSHGNPDDDSGNGPFGGNSAVSFDGEPLAQNPTFIVVLGNGTLVFPEDSDSV